MSLFWTAAPALSRLAFRRALGTSFALVCVAIFVLLVVLAMHNQERTAHFLHHAVEPERLELLQCGIK